MFKPEGIIIHCSATRPNWMQSHSIEEQAAEIRRWHVEESGWRDIGYAKLYGRGGSTAMGRDLNDNDDPFDDVGAHTKGWNRKAIGLCLIGGHGSAANDSPHEHFTDIQLAALRTDILELMQRFPSIKWVKGHNQFANKSCPGFDAQRWWEERPKKTGALMESNTNKASFGLVVDLAAQYGNQVVTPLVTDNPTAQTWIAAGLSVAGVCFVGYIIYSRVVKQRRGVV